MLSLVTLLGGLAALAQAPVPIITTADRFVVFDGGVFKDLEPRKPQRVFQNGDRLAYVSDAGDLKLYDHGQVTVLQRDPAVEFYGSLHAMAWRSGPALRVPAAEGATTICHGTGTVAVSDSLVVFYDALQHVVNAYWHGQVVPIVDALMTDDVPGLTVGVDMATIYDPAGRRLLYFEDGRTTVLLQGVDEAPVQLGGGVAAYVDERDGSFHVMDQGQQLDLDAFPPLSAKAGYGLVAYVAASGEFRCYRNGNIYPLASTAPSEYWVQDSVLLFVDQGQLKTFVDDRIDVVERYVPEIWAVRGSTIAYLDLNRQLRTYRRGERVLVTKEAGIKQFELYPGALLYRSNSGIAKVWWRGKLYEHY